MEMLRRSSVFASEVFDRSPTDKELVSQAKALCRDYIHAKLNRAGIGWSKPEHGLSSSAGSLGEISSVLLWLGRFRKPSCALCTQWQLKQRLAITFKCVFNTQKGSILKWFPSVCVYHRGHKVRVFLELNATIYLNDFT